MLTIIMCKSTEYSFGTTSHSFHYIAFNSFINLQNKPNANILNLTIIHCVSIKSSPFFICDNFRNCKPIQIIFCRNIAEKIWNKLMYENVTIVRNALPVYIVK